MTRSPTASIFRDPILQALGALSGGIAGKEVPFGEVFDWVLKDLGLKEDQFGDDQNGRPKTRLWLNEAFNKNLKKRGLTGSRSRGNWYLTDEGVGVVQTLSPGTTPEPVEESTKDPEPAPAQTSTPVGIHGDGTGVCWTVGEQVNNYNVDPYIQGLAISATRCFGEWSSRSDVCKSCQISGACKATLMTTLSEIGDQLDKRDAEARRPKPEPKPEPEPAPAPEAEPEDDLDIEDILNAIENESEPAPSATDPAQDMIASADVLCTKCKGKISRGDPSKWLRGTGMYHPGCYTAPK